MIHLSILLRAGLLGLALCLFPISVVAQAVAPILLGQTTSGASLGNETQNASSDMKAVPAGDAEEKRNLTDEIAEAVASGPMVKYYTNWLATAQRAEKILEAERASNGILETLRLSLVSYRQRFLEASSDNENRIVALREQIEALGEETDEEAQAIKLLRNNLQSQINALTLPQVVANLAYSRAQALVAEIDKTVRNRATRRLLERSPSPLNPEHWTGTLKEISDVLVTFGTEITQGLQSQTQREALRGRVPVLLFLTGAALWLLIRGAHWSRRAGAYLRQFGGRGSGVWSFVVSLLQVVLPYAGTILLLRAIDLSGVLGVRGTLLLDPVPYWSFLMFATYWLGERVYVYQLNNELVPYQKNSERLVRRLLDASACMLVLHLLLERIDDIENLSEATFAVLSLPLVTISALFLLRLAHVRRKQIRNEDKAKAQVENQTVAVAGANRGMLLLRQLSSVFAVLAPVLVAVGYVNAATSLIYPVILTVGVVTLMVILRHFIADVYGWLTGGDGAQESLFAGIAGFALSFLAIPLLALIWGARTSDLTEVWSRFLGGVSLGETRISPAVFVTFVAVFAIGYVSTRLLQGSLRNSLLPKTRIDAGGQNAIVAGTGYVGIFLSALVAISWAGLDLSSLAIVAGALSVGIGFGLQTIVSNFVSGIILLVERPVSKGDWIEVGGQMGYVRDISVRSTRIETFDRTDVIVPNSDLITGTVTNFTRGNTVGRVIVPVGVAYGTDPRRVEKILDEIAKGHPMVLMRPPPTVVFQGFGADSLDFEIRAILRDVNWVLSVKSDINYEIARRFKEEGIEIPFAQRDIWLRNPEALHPAPPSNVVSGPPQERVADIDFDADPDGADPDGAEPT